MPRPESSAGELALRTFEEQAAHFDERAGIPEPALRAIAACLLGLAGSRPGSTFLEIGAGTGEIGIALLTRARGAMDPYTGLDVAPAMIERFRARAAALGLSPTLIVADATGPWPVAPRSVHAVFGSRSLHWIEPAHLLDEVLRVAHPEGATLLAGRVERDPEGPRARIRRKMRALLREHGYEGRNGAKDHAALLAECTRRGGVLLEPRVAAAWQVRRSPRASLDDWARKPGLAGVDLPLSTKRSVLDGVRRWTHEAFGNIDTLIESEERYVLEGAVLVPERSPSR